MRRAVPWSKTRVSIFATLALSAGGATLAQDPPEVTGDQVRAWIEELNNWGRWGEDDELGALNLITPAKRRAAAALVRDGVSLSLAHDALTEPAPDNSSPLEHQMIDTGSSPWTVDRFAVLYHGLAHTHLDALCHIAHDGNYYNGIPKSSTTEKGCERLGITSVREGALTRGVLIDIPWVKGVDYLEPGYAVTPADVAAWEEKTGTRVQPGDAVLLYTGRWARREKLGAWPATEGLAGFHASCIPWLKEMDIAILGSDAGADVMPNQVADGAGLSPIHLFALVALGAHILDNGDFEELAAYARKSGRWDFLLSFGPLRIDGGTGSPLNPIATF